MSSKSAEKETSMTFEEILDKDGELFFTNEGCSMLPLIHAHQDILHIKKVERPLVVGDIVLYKDAPHHYVLHRILKLKKDGQIICAGDNNSWKDKPIDASMILGRLIEVTYPDGKHINVDTDYRKEGLKYTRCFAFKALGLKLKRLLRK